MNESLTALAVVLLAWLVGFWLELRHQPAPATGGTTITVGPARLLPGDVLAVDGYHAFLREQLLAVARAVGVPYDELTRDPVPGQVVVVHSVDAQTVTVARDI